MKIFYIITKANWGGAQSYVFDLAKASLNAGNEVVVLYGENGLLAKKLTDSGIASHKIFGLTRSVGIRNEVRAFARLLRILKKEKPDTIHINSSKAGALGALAGRIAGIRAIIFTAHGWAFNEARPLWQRLTIYFIAGITISLSHKTICVADAVRKDMRYFPFIRKKMCVIRNGIQESTALSREEARARIAPPTVARYWIGMLSELHPTKRVQDAIEAIALLSEKHPDILLVVVGEGQERETLRARIRARKMQQHIFLAGFIPNASQLLTAFDIFLHTSQSEALAYAVLEAGSVGLPVVATSVGGIPEIITSRDLGTLVPAHNPQAVTDALSAYLHNMNDAREKGAKLKTRVLTEFSSVKMITETLDTYREILPS